LALNNEFSSTEQGEVRGVISELSLRIKELNFDLSNIFESLAINAIESSENSIDNLVSNSETLITLSEFIKENIDENSEDMLRFCVDEAFQNSQKITEAFRHNIKALKGTLKRLKRYEVNLQTLKIISHYSAKNSANNPLQYQRNLGFIGEVVIGGLRGVTKRESGNRNRIGEVFARIEEQRRPNPENFLNKYLPLADKASWLNPEEFRQNLASFGFYTAYFLFNNLSPEQIIDLVFNYIYNLTNSPQEFRSNFGESCHYVISLKMNEFEELLLPLVQEIMDVSGNNLISFYNDVKAVKFLKDVLIEELGDSSIGTPISMREINETLFELVKSAVKASGDRDRAFQFRENLGDKIGIGNLVMELEGIIGIPDEIKEILVERVPKAAGIACKKKNGREIPLLFRDLLKEIIEEYE
jgi:hypothetical protein